MKRKRKTDREVLKEIFPKEIVQEVDAILGDIDRGPRATRKNPSEPSEPKPEALKPWGEKWVAARRKRRK